MSVFTMGHTSLEKIISLQRNPANIRNLCILAHVDHGGSKLFIIYLSSHVSHCGRINKHNEPNSVEDLTELLFGGTAEQVEYEEGELFNR